MLTIWGLDLEMERRYWAYVETHPAHADVNLRAVQEAIELLTWHYTGECFATLQAVGAHIGALDRTPRCVLPGVCGLR